MSTPVLRLISWIFHCSIGVEPEVLHQSVRNITGVEPLASITGVERMPIKGVGSDRGTGPPPSPQSSRQSALPALPGGLFELLGSPCLLHNRLPACVPSATHAKMVSFSVTATNMLQPLQVPCAGLETVMPTTYSGAAMIGFDGAFGGSWYWESSTSKKRCRVVDIVE